MTRLLIEFLDAIEGNAPYVARIYSRSTGKVRSRRLASDRNSYWFLRDLKPGRGHNVAFGILDVDERHEVCPKE